MANSRIGCSAGKTTLIDPNNFYGQDSSNNISVPLEDLNISVQLSTFKKGRTLLTANNTVKTTQSSKKVSVTFIEGTEVNGEKFLTSKFTDLTTVFDKDNDSSENLGITNIDVDFNSSYAPLVTINFLDLRGSSIFQNESQLNNNENKYSVFFQLPYPLYELTIKGYYGQPVKYCLHMTKFNSKFNAQTGNFEITANFIGYTYAMLSDMLLGILKAIPYTSRGMKKYEQAIIEDPKVLNLNELMIEISKIDENIEKVAASNPNAAKLTYLKNMENSLDDMIRVMDLFGSMVDIDSDYGDYEYIVIKGVHASQKTSYDTNITDIIKVYNENSVNASSGLWMPTTDFVNLIKKKKAVLTAAGTAISRGVATDDVYIMVDLYKTVDKHKEAVTKKRMDTEKIVALTIKDEITEGLGFEPTIKNIVNCFTVAVEIFLSIIFDVSTEAESGATAAGRKAELKAAFKTDDNHSDLKQSVKDKFYPWPDYRENTKDGYKEKYLGTLGVLKNPRRVTELVFIDDLYEAFLTAKQKANEAALAQSIESKVWTPVNPFDTMLYCKSPYDRLDVSASEKDIMTLIMLRGMTFLGFSNNYKYYTQQNIVDLANSEVNLIKADTKLNALAKTALATKTENDFIDKVGWLIDTTPPASAGQAIKILGSGTVAITGALSIPVYFYNFIFNKTIGSPNSDYKLLMPLSNGFKGEWNSLDSALVTRGKDDVFLTNYGSQKVYKANDGGRYIDIMTVSDFNQSGIINKGFVESFAGLVKEYVINEGELASGAATAFNVFGGNYGVQEFSKIKLKSNGLDLDMNLKYVFYKDYSFGNSNVLTYPRGSSNTLGVHANTGLSMLGGNGQNRYLFSLNDTAISYPYIDIKVQYNGSGPIHNVGLFSSKLYYIQDKAGRFEQYNKALLFLNTLPFNGDSFEEDVIKNLFNKVGGFIHAPRLWCAYIGGLMWRQSALPPEYDSYGVKIIGGGSGPNTNPPYTDDPIYWDVSSNGSGINYTNEIPSFNHNTFERFEYFNVLNGENNSYDDLLIYLPSGIKDQFKKAFFDFVNNTSFGSGPNWNDIKAGLEIWDGSGVDYVNAVNGIYAAADPYNTNIWDYPNFNKNNIKNYEVITYNSSLNKSTGDFNNDGFYCELKNDATRVIIDALRGEVVIANSGPKPWEQPNTSALMLTTPNNKDKAVIFSKKEDMDLYVKTIVAGFSGATFSESQQARKNAQDVFGTDNEDVIKLQLYKTCKNVYDKWVGGAKDGDSILFQACGGGDPVRNNIDKKLAKKKRGGSSKAKLIDSFRFVTRSFRDVGDEFFIDPRPVNTYLTDNPNSSFYDAVTNLLASNNFDFIALPSFINYNNPATMESIFETYSYHEHVGDGICGPSFVCVYVGQTSKHLDFNGSDYTNDGFDVQCIGGNMSTSIPLDFSSKNEDYENNVAVFKVAYSQQNQNIFKDITLDQSEFSETEESLKIIDDISKTGSENQRHFGGQNLYSVYGVRSYKAEVEMMGNAMIQPMMYFQLDNIPMFHGAYMITHVKHSIQPNTMSTHFTGVRIRHPETPILTASEVYMSLLQNLQITATNTATTPGINYNTANVKIALKYFITTKGYPVWKAQGIVAAIMGESGGSLSPTIVNPTSGAYGIAQWLGTRLTKLKLLPNYDTLQVQLEFMESELNADSIAVPIIAYATNANEMMAAMGAFERWGYPVSLAKNTALPNKNGQIVSGAVNYERMYPVLLSEAISGISPDASFAQRIQYLKQVKKIYNEMVANGEI